MGFAGLPRPFFVGRLFGIPIKLDWSWLPVMPLYTWAVATMLLPRSADGQMQPEYWLFGAATTFLLVASIVVHELAHALVAKAEGIEIQDITLYLFGGMARMLGEPATPMAELKIAAVGAGASI